MPRPRVSVLMPVRNGLPHVRSAVGSILRQSLHDLELLAIDDASTDGTGVFLQEVADPRVRVLRNESNAGIADSLNRGLDEAAGEYIARMDADDIAYPARLVRQVQYLDAHPDVGVCGTWFRPFPSLLPCVERRPASPAAAAAWLVFANPLCHPSVIFRRDLFRRENLRYDATYSRCEDFELWSRSSQKTQLANLPEVLLRMRVHRGSVTGAYRGEMNRQSGKVVLRHLAPLLPQVSEEELAFHVRIGQAQPVESVAELRRAETWLRRLVEQNAARGAHAPTVFGNVVSQLWFQLCRNSARLGPAVVDVFSASPLAGPGHPPTGDRMRFILAAYFPRRHSGRPSA